MRSILLFISLSCLLSSTSCKKYKPATPAFFIVPEPVSVQTSAAQGSGSHKITDLGLYVDGQFMGSYPAGSKLPVINNDRKVKINVLAGIKNNGISDTRVFWPFFEPFELDTLVSAGETVSRPITFRYSSAVTFTWNENFDSGQGYTVVKSDVSDTTFTVDKTGGMEGQALRMTLAGRSMVGQVESSGSGFTLPKGSTNVYLELNYKCNEIFTVGLIDASQLMRPVIHINPQQSWNKIYIALGETVNLPYYSTRYKVYFRILKRDVSNPEFSIDNIKLVYL